MLAEPRSKPTDARFSSGPCLKPSGWSLAGLGDAFLSRSHRSLEGQKRILDVLSLSEEILKIPKHYKIIITPASATGAITVAMWNFLGSRPVDVLVWDVFGERWASDACKLPVNTYVHKVPFGQSPNFSNLREGSDLLFVWNGTSTGSSVGGLSWRSDPPNNSNGLMICDATSAAFGVDLPWESLDVTCFSWQKVMGGEAAHGMMVLSPKALSRLESHTPAWPIPYLLSLKKNGVVRESLFSGDVINTPSMLCLEDFRQSLLWAQANGGGAYLVNKTNKNYNAVQSWIERVSWAENLVSNPIYHAKTVACIRLKHANEYLTEAQILKLTKFLAEKEVAFDIKGFKGLPSNLRIWTGPTIDKENLLSLLDWVEWAYHEKVFL